MIQLYVSDYVANSLLYHAYKHNVLDIGVNAEDSDNLKKVLRTTCQGSFCIGDSLTAAATQFPDHYVDVTIEPDQVAWQPAVDRACSIEAIA